MDREGIPKVTRQLLTRDAQAAISIAFLPVLELWVEMLRIADRDPRQARIKRVILDGWHRYLHTMLDYTIRAAEFEHQMLRITRRR